MSKRTNIWEPKEHQKYYYINDEGDIVCEEWRIFQEDFFRQSIGNCFETFQEAVDCRDNLMVKQQLKNLALELNNGAEIDWSDYNQQKFYIAYKGFFINPCSFELGYSLTVQSTRKKILGITYCLNPNFLKIAQQNIGAEKLIKLFKSEL